MHVREFIEKYYPEYYGWFDYPADKTAAFCKSDEPWGILGNFGKTPLIVGGVPFDCAEKLFQVMKFSATESRRLVYSVSGQHIKMTAKRKDLAPTIRSDWGMIIVDVLKFCLMQKYEQSEASVKNLNAAGSCTSSRSRTIPGNLPTHIAPNSPLMVRPGQVPT